MRRASGDARVRDRADAHASVTASFLSERRLSRADRHPVFAQHRQQIEKGAAGSNLKGDARAFIVLDQEDAIAKDAEYEVYRGSVHNDELHGPAKALAELSFLGVGLPE